MYKLLLNSFGTKVLSALFSFAMVLMTTHYLGIDGRGEVAVITITVNLIILFNNMIGSSALVYLTPRRNFYQLLIPSYIWAVVGSVLAYGGLIYFSDVIWEASFFFEKNATPVSASLIKHIVILGFLGAIFEMNSNVLLGEEKVVPFNLVGVFRFLMLVLVLVVLFVGFEASVKSFLIAMYVGYISGTLATFFLYFKSKTKFSLEGIMESTKSILNYGIQDQVAVILHFLNYRIATYALFFIYGKADTGLFSIVMFLLEALLMVSNSFSLVQYSKVVNSEDEEYNHYLTLTLFKLTSLILVVGGVVISVIPSSFYQWLIGKDFVGINMLFAAIVPGAIAYGGTVFFNNYMCSVGKFYHNIISNSLGMIVSIVCCYYVIPKWGTVGASLTVSMTYIVVGGYSLLAYIKETPVTLSDVFYQKGLITQITKLLKA